MMESYGSWKFSNVYVDEKATPRQREALLAIATKVLPIDSSPRRDPVRAINRAISGKEHTISLASTASSPAPDRGRSGRVGEDRSTRRAPTRSTRSTTRGPRR